MTTASAKDRSHESIINDELAAVARLRPLPASGLSIHGSKRPEFGHYIPYQDGYIGVLAGYSSHFPRSINDIAEHDMGDTDDKSFSQ